MRAAATSRADGAVLAGAFVLGTLLLTLATIEMLPGWVPVGDDAIIALRSYDAVHGDVPLLGMPSTAGEGVFHPGPLQFWVTGLADLVVGPGAVMVVGVAVHFAAILTLLAVGRSLGGPPGAVVVALGCFALSFALYPSLLVRPLNPNIAVFPFAAAAAALLLATIRPGRRWPLVVSVAMASWAMQAHLVFAVLGLVVLGPLAVAMGVAAWRRRRWPSSLGWSALLLVALWSGPIYEAVTEAGGNGRTMVETATGGGDDTARLGYAGAWSIVSRAVVERPLLLDPDVHGFDLSRGSGGPAQIVLGVVLVGLVAMALRVRSSRPVLASVTAVTVLLALGVVATTARIPRLNVLALYNHLPMWILNVALWGVVLAGVFTAVARAVSRRDEWRARWSDLVSRLPVVALVVAVLVLPLLPDRGFIPGALGSSEGNPPVDYVRTIAPQLDAVLARDRPYYVEIPWDFEGFAVAAGLVHAMVQAGYDVRVDEALGRSYGERRGVDAVEAAELPKLFVFVGQQRFANRIDPRGEVVAFHLPETALVEARELAVAVLTRRLLASPAEAGAEALAVGDDEQAMASFVRDRLPALVASDIIRGPLADESATKFLVGLLEEPHRVVRVVLLEPRPAQAESTG